ncbi:DUF4085 family protein [Clostridium tetani]|uniref:DUF4085 family protein n=1 Tax=Clostridium tetani TaxID=1513 RepID=UPI0024A9F833|nr:DUF4085 family protein [Clostridium tetani]
MKYFTKEWYKLSQNTSYHISLEEEKSAEVFSEEYFQELYKGKLKRSLENKKRINKYILQLGEESKIPYEPFNEEKESNKFHEAFLYNQEHMKKVLPEEILKKIADIKVFILDKASHEVIKAVTKFCKNNEKLVEKTFEEYQKYYEKALKTFDKHIVENINFHDCNVIDVKQTKESLKILFDNSGGFTNINEIQFENYNIIKQDDILQGSWWIYDEVYKVDDNYELHVLLQNKNKDLIEFVASFEQISFKRNEEK